MDSGIDFHTARALLEWQIDLGADEAISETPINRYEVPKKAPPIVAKPAPEPTMRASQKSDPAAIASQLAAGCGSLEALQVAIAEFELCELKRGARNMVFSDGDPKSKVMIIAGTPDADEDRQGKPFAGPVGRLFDQMLACIGHGRADVENPVYMTSAMPWRTPQNREPTPDEIAMMVPFLRRHIEIVNPDVLVLIGNVPCMVMLDEKGITKLRGSWREVLGKPALPMLNPSQLLRSPDKKRDAWHDLLMLQAKVRSL